MSALPSRSAHGTGVISELALARAQRNTVLIIDDLFSSRLLIAEIVRQIDPKLNLELFDTPSRALEYARQNRVDMVLTDFKLPEFDGIELVKQIRGLGHCVDIPIVVITVVDDRQVRYNALEGGRDRLPDQAARRARNPRALRESAGIAPAQDRPVRPGEGAAVSGRPFGLRDSRARARDAVQARQGRRVSRQDHRQSSHAHGQVLRPHRAEPRAWRQTWCT